jgi:hypothetical protein
MMAAQKPGVVDVFCGAFFQKSDRLLAFQAAATALRSASGLALIARNSVRAGPLGPSGAAFP